MARATRGCGEHRGRLRHPESSRISVGEKFLNFLEVAETDANFRAEISAVVAKIMTTFERWQLAQYFETAKETEPFDLNLFEGDDEFDDEEVEDMRKDDIRLCTGDLLLVEQARDLLLE